MDPGMLSLHEAIVGILPLAALRPRDVVLPGAGRLEPERKGISISGRLTRRILELRAVPSGTVLNSRTTSQQKSGAVPRRVRI